MENSHTLDSAVADIADYIRVNGISNEAIRAACDIAVEHVHGSIVGKVRFVLVEAKRRSMDVVATRTKLRKMLQAETITESELTGNTVELVYNVFVGHAQDIVAEMRRA